MDLAFFTELFLMDLIVLFADEFLIGLASFAPTRRF